MRLRGTLPFNMPFQPIEADPPALLPIFDLAFKADPHPLYDALRADGGVCRMRLPSGTTAWLATSHDVARRLLADKRLSKEQRSRTPLFNHLLTTDPPRHTRLRIAIAPHFTRASLIALAPAVRARARTLLDRLPHEGAFDLLADFAAPLAFGVVCDLVGVPERSRLAVARALDALERAEFEAPDRIDTIARRLSSILKALSDRATGGEGARSLLATLARACKDGSIDSDDVAALSFVVLAAGRETTANLIANGMLRLLTSTPNAWREACGSAQQAESVVDELLRLESPLEMATARHALEAIEIDGVVIEQGDLIFVCLAAANRDPAVFAQPDALDPSKGRSKGHLAFGHGVHRCIGAALARMEACIALAALADRFRDLQLDMPAAEVAASWKPGLISRGLCRLRVTSAARTVS